MVLPLYRQKEPPPDRPGRSVVQRTGHLGNILSDHAEIAREITSKVKIIPAFKAYLDHGKYPFYREGGGSFHNKLLASSQVVLDSDMPAIENWEWKTIQKAKKLLGVIAPNVPLVPNIKRLAEQLECSRETCMKILHALANAGQLMPQQGDFLVDDRCLFEVGGDGKTFERIERIKNVENSYLAVDDTEIGFRNRIPLWFFGLTY